jgi:hypothetical protein
LSRWLVAAKNELPAGKLNLSLLPTWQTWRLMGRNPRALDLAPSTVKTYLSQLLVHLGASNRTDASIKARMLDLV